MSDNTPDSTQQQVQQTENVTIQTFISSLLVAFVVFVVQVVLFILIKQKLPRIYRPRTYLVPEKERINAPPTGIWQWIKPVFHTSNSDFIQKCGLDAYFFLRYLRMLLKIFVPISLIILPVLIPVNAVGGRGTDYINEAPFNKRPQDWNTTTGLNQLAWGNVRPTRTGRYWVHLCLAVAVVLYCFYIFYDELRGYIRLRQAYLTSPQHRLRASATTVLVSAIPRKWCNIEALDGMYDVFPGGIRNIWINRNFDALSEKVKERNKIALKLESAETDLIKKAKKNQMKALEKEAKKAGTKQTKEERAAEKKEQDEQGAKMAETGGQTSGGTDDSTQERKPGVPVVGGGLESMGKGLEKFGKSVFGGFKGAGDGVSSMLNTTQGFQLPAEEDRESWPLQQNDGVGDGVGPGYDLPGAEPPHGRNGLPSTNPNINATPHSQQSLANGARTPPKPTSGEEPLSPASKYSSQGIDDRINRKTSPDAAPNGTVEPGASAAKPKKFAGIIPIRSAKDQAPGLTMASPKPKGHEANGYFEHGEKKQQSFLDKAQFWKKGEEEQPEVYPDAFDKSYDSVESDTPVWKKYVQPSDRDTMRLPVFGKKWLGWIPLIGQKVDTIDHCRKELARLNLEIETDQKEPEKFPIMNSAFIQFNHQVAAHMACQSVSHHVPSQMAPRVIEISPGDVIWDNLSIQWWARYLRTGGIILVIGGLILTWTFPVAFTGLLANVKYLAQTYAWLNWLARIPNALISIVQGVLPQLLLAILLALLPIVLRFLTKLQGHPTGMTVELALSDYYFVFLFVQVFLVVTIAAGATNVFAVAGQLGAEPQSIPTKLAQAIPRASNYYFSYMILQAFSNSASTLVQIGALVVWFLLAPLLDSTARAKWKRQITLPDMKWGTFFPLYTNLACIGLIYSVIAPFILFFNCITFSLFWFVFRYNTLYVTKFEFDTGGLLFPKAINQLFTGLYVMEICLVGLFFLVTDVNDDGSTGGPACIPQAIIMIVVLIITIIYHVMLNYTFGPLIRYLPITLEDDAVERDEEFSRAQEKRFNLAEEEQPGDDINDILEEREDRERQEDAQAEQTEMEEIKRRRRKMQLNPLSLVQSAGEAIVNTGNAVMGTLSPTSGSNWADRRYSQDQQAKRRSSQWMYNPAEAHDGNARADDMARQHRLRLSLLRDHNGGGDGAIKEGQNTAIGDALFAGIHDEIEDLSSEDRDFLVQRAFHHEALRARRPVVWIPRDDLGVSDDEVHRTRTLTDHVWISNEHTGLDSKVRVVYRKSPPDFSEVDLIEL